MGNKKQIKNSENSNIEELEQTILNTNSEVTEGENVNINSEVTEGENVSINSEVTEGENVSINSESNENKSDEDNSDEDKSNEDEVKIAVVTNCTKLNVRKEPSKEAEVLCVIKESEKVTLSNEEASYEDFYKVITSTGVEGYCMKQYIATE